MQTPEIDPRAIIVIAMFVATVAGTVKLLARRITKATYKPGSGLTFEFGEKGDKSSKSRRK
jgi:hypothetical protein